MSREEQDAQDAAFLHYWRKNWADMGEEVTIGDAQTTFNAGWVAAQEFGRRQDGQNDGPE